MYFQSKRPAFLAKLGLVQRTKYGVVASKVTISSLSCLEK